MRIVHSYMIYSATGYFSHNVDKRFIDDYSYITIKHILWEGIIIRKITKCNNFIKKTVDIITVRW